MIRAGRLPTGERGEFGRHVGNLGRARDALRAAGLWHSEAATASSANLSPFSIRHNEITETVAAFLATAADIAPTGKE
jgi:hypothetical protein